MNKLSEEKGKVNIDKVADAILLSILSFNSPKEIFRFFATSKKFYSKMKNKAFIGAFFRENGILQIKNTLPTPDDSLLYLKNIYSKIQIPKQNWETIPWLPCHSTSTDENQSIYCSTDGADGFWGTGPSDNEDGLSYALFDLGEDYMTKLVKEVNIVFTHFYYVYVEGEIIGNPVYQSKTVTVEIGFCPSKPIFVSEHYECSTAVKMGENIKVTIPVTPTPVLGRYIKVNFHGYRCRHTLKDNRFYLCIDSIIPKGIKFAEGDRDMMERSIESYYEQMKQQSGQDNVQAENHQQYRDSQYDTYKNYYKKIGDYNQEAMVELRNCGEDKEKLIAFFNSNAHMKYDKVFIKYLMDNEKIADIYFEHLFTMQVYLNMLETIAVLSLSLDWEKLKEGSENQNFLKNQKYLGMFWLFYYVQDELYQYLGNSLQQSPEKAFELVKPENVKEVDKVQLCGALELKKILLTFAMHYKEAVEDPELAKEGNGN